MIVELTQKQMDFAADELNKYKPRKKLKDAHGLKKGELTDYDEYGAAAAELALSIFLEVAWCNDMADKNGPDVGTRTQVRSSNKPRKKHHLIIRPRDFDKYGNVPFVLIIQDGLKFEIKGWCMSGEVKEYGRYWDGANGRPKAWFIPENKLRPICELTDP